MKSVGNMTPVTKGLIALVVLVALVFGAKHFVGNKQVVTSPSDSTAVNADSLTQNVVLPADGTITTESGNVTIKLNTVNQTETIAPVKRNHTPKVTTTKVKTTTTKPVVKEKKKSTDRENLELNNF